MTEEEKTTNENETLSSLSDDEVESIRKEAREKASKIVHTWKQKGNVVVCESCEYHHGFYIDPNYRLVDIKGGKPIFRKLK